MKKEERKKEKSSLHNSFYNPQFGKYDTLIKYTLVPSIPLSIIAILSFNPNTWVSSEIHHFYVELFAVILAAILSFYYIERAYTLNDKFSLFIGLGFLANALIDLLHVIVSYTFMDEFLFLKYFIPQTWFAGRIFLSAMFAIAIAGYPALASAGRSMKSSSTSHISSRSSSSSSRKAAAELSSPPPSRPPTQYSASPSLRERNNNNNKKREKIPKFLVASLVILTILSAFVAISSLFIIYPGSVIDNFPLHRLYEIPALVLFLVALLYFYKNQLYKKSDVFYKGILGALVIDIFGQIIMSYSATSFDTAHNVSHALKDVGYFVNIIGLALSSIQYSAKLKEANRNLIEREEIIRSQYEKLKESDKMKNEFINIAAHELRTPILPILGISQILRPKVDDKEREYMDVIIRNAKRLQRLAENILDVTKIESQSLKLNKERFNLNDVITNTIDDIILNTVFKNKKNYDDGDNIKLKYRPKNIFVEADSVRMTQVMYNLLHNAIKFTKEGGGSISINTEKEDNHILVSVKDTGTGIDPEILPRLFSKFASKSFEGTGLGLFISKGIIEAHGGKIWAVSNNNNIIADGEKGATFFFTLPVSDQ
ncbi:MAG TPA: ATP-binding protein [Nitrososphaeraceae archaeon]|jgi:signal transduction histidine kinase|nr:ATP-binding protein [Nitrososphaeraceae archaeon]